MPRDLQPAFVRKMKAQPLRAAGLSEGQGYLATRYFITKKGEEREKTAANPTGWGCKWYLENGGCGPGYVLAGLAHQLVLAVVGEVANRCCTPFCLCR